MVYSTTKTTKMVPKSFGAILLSHIGKMLFSVYILEMKLDACMYWSDFFKKFFFWVSLKFCYITTRKCAVNNCKQVHVVKLSNSISSVLNFRTNFFAFVYEFTNRANLVLIENVERFVDVFKCGQYGIFINSFRLRVGAQGLLYSSPSHTTEREATFWENCFGLKLNRLRQLCLIIHKAKTCYSCHIFHILPF